jgi:adenylosuccinate lyase
MERIWSEENKFRKWLEIEILACEAWCELGKIPREALQDIKEKASFKVERIKELEKTTGHDVVAFLANVAEEVGESARYIHYGLTSSDIGDTSLCLLMREAVEILITDVKEVIRLLKEKARLYQDTLMVGRTHGVHAEPITFGFKLAGWAFEMARHLQNLERVKDKISVGKLSGAVGTYASVDPFVERYVCEKLGLKRADISTQIVQRDLHADYMAALALTASSIEKMATEIRSLQRTEVREVEEPFVEGQKGSSAMPHKRNPILCERLCGLARMVRSYSLVAMENVSLWHERDISHSSAERIIIPDATILLDYMLDKLKFILQDLVVYPEDMLENLSRTRGLIYSQRVLLFLIEKGMSREKAYEIVQRQAMTCWQGEEDFLGLLLKDPDISALTSAEEIKSCFEDSCYTRHIPGIIDRIDELSS